MQRNNRKSNGGRVPGAGGVSWLRAWGMALGVGLATCALLIPADMAEARKTEDRPWVVKKKIQVERPTEVRRKISAPVPARSGPAAATEVTAKPAAAEATPATAVGTTAQPVKATPAEAPAIQGQATPVEGPTEPVPAPREGGPARPSQAEAPARGEYEAQAPGGAKNVYRKKIRMPGAAPARPQPAPGTPAEGTPEPEKPETPVQAKPAPEKQAPQPEEPETPMVAEAPEPPPEAAVTKPVEAQKPEEPKEPEKPEPEEQEDIVGHKAEEDADEAPEVPAREFAYDDQDKTNPFMPLVEGPATQDQETTETEGDRPPRQLPKEVRPKSPLEKFDLGQLQVVGIMRTPERRIALVEEPSGRGYIVTKGMYIGVMSGQVVDIQDDKMIVEETVTDIFGKVSTRTTEMKLYEVVEG